MCGPHLWEEKAGPVLVDHQVRRCQGGGKTPPRLDRSAQTPGRRKGWARSRDTFWEEEKAPIPEFLCFAVGCLAGNGAQCVLVQAQIVQFTLGQ
jgi:hypothetical protein